MYRSNEEQGIGFLADARRLNVALTRARHAVVLVGNARLLGRQSTWNQLLRHCKDLKVIVEGSVSNMVQSRINFPFLKKDTPLPRLPPVAGAAVGTPFPPSCYGSTVVSFILRVAYESFALSFSHYNRYVLCQSLRSQRR